MSLVARHLEEHGVPTVLIGSAWDIVTHCGVPRFLFTDFPLGNPCGHPWQPVMQAAIVGQALDMLETAPTPGTIERAPFAWKDDPGWRQRYNLVTDENRAALRALGDARRARLGQVPKFN